MTLPTFLGIGVPRAGTTWLHSLLASHPAVYLPTQRKEIRFFDRHYDEGTAWYERFFCPPQERERYRAIGEISPQYLYDPRCPDRIAELLPDAKLIVMLRHPVARAYSQYGFVIQRRGYRGSFDAFVASRPRALEMGHYATYLAAYRRRFERDRILLLLFEEAVGEGGNARGELARFLGIGADGFGDVADRVNPSTVPRFRGLSSFAVRTGRRLRRHHLEPLVDLAGRLGVRRFLTSGGRIPRLDPEVKVRLSERYEADFEELERSWDLDLTSWRATPASGGRPDLQVPERGERAS
ncbi:MAG TPA: sulfotransferase [Actinomycetota bacterium]|nr:sulfotransferase [Actinomycetota bacterium]